MKAYLDLVRLVLETGSVRTDRTGVGTKSIFGTQTKYDLREGFPLVTTKRVPFASVVKELLWFIRGSTNIRDLGCGIWNEWAQPDGSLGKIYGAQWRYWGGSQIGEGVDQLAGVIHQIKTTPDSRRIILSAWNVADLPDMALPPCHLLVQFYVVDGRLDCQLYQRSADLALGVPFNIASYALLMIMIAQECRLVPGIFTHTIGDAHVYLNHIAGLQEQLTREPLPLPRVLVANVPVFDVKFDDVLLWDYHSHPPIKFDVAV